MRGLPFKLDLLLSLFGSSSVINLHLNTLTPDKVKRNREKPKRSFKVWFLVMKIVDHSLDIIGYFKTRIFCSYSSFIEFGISNLVSSKANRCYC